MKDNSYTRTPSQIFPSGVFELTVRYERKKMQRVKVVKSGDAVEFIRENVYEKGTIEYTEQFWLLMCDRNNQIFCFKKISEGGQAGTVCDPKIIFQTVLLSHASSIICCHNHPSGQLQPSEHDIRLTKNLVQSGKLLEIRMLDHVIVTSESHYSFADEGML
jgi:DNA repair protein RadC